MARYRLARHVFVCRDEDYVVVLDVKQDRYFSLEAAKTAILPSVVSGWPVTGQRPTGAVVEDAVERAVRPLLRQGWLVEESTDAREAMPVNVPRPESQLTAEGDGRPERISLRTLFAFVVASVLAKAALRFWPFERVVRRVAQRKARFANDPVDLERARRLIEAFERMRVFLFSTRDECLHDSLAVLEFLARYRIFPTWVFGVRARPFVAHCWVQHADVVFNDTVEHVSTYVPIMAV
ncbi:MAG TPA: lasso peptide biosynthesis B2 protein [Steroidobacteraceae bacterium]